MVAKKLDRMVFGDGKIMFLLLKQEEIIHLQFERLLQVIDELDHRPDGGFSDLMLFIEGYDDAVEELYEIDKVRRYMNRFIRKVPHFLFYINPENGMREQILTSLSDFNKIAVGKLESPNAVLERGGDLKELGKHLISINMERAVAQELIDSTKNHAEKISCIDIKEGVSELLNFIENCVKGNKN